MKQLDIKEMSLQEKYDQLLESFILTMATDYALFKELGAIDRYLDMHVTVRKKMLPRLLGTALKIFKTVSPRRTIEQVVKRYIYTQQMYLPKKNIEIRWASKQDIVGKISNCPNLSRLRDIVKQADLPIDPRFHCTIEAKVLHELAKTFGLDAKVEIDENGCQFTGTLR